MPIALRTKSKTQCISYCRKIGKIIGERYNWSNYYNNISINKRYNLCININTEDNREQIFFRREDKHEPERFIITDSLELFLADYYKNKLKEL